MIKPFITALALTVALTGVVAQAQAKTQPGTHLMWVTPYKAAPYAVRHQNASCPNMPFYTGK